MGLVRAATVTVEAYLGRELLTRTLRLSLDKSPETGFEPGFRIGVRVGPLERTLELTVCTGLPRLLDRLHPRDTGKVAIKPL